MPQISLIKHSDIKLAQRFDAEYFEVHELIKRIWLIKSSDLLSESKWITQWPNPKFSLEWKHCLTWRNIASWELKLEWSDFVDDNEFQELKRFRLLENDILITLKGAWSTWKVALFNSKEPCIFSRNLWIVRLKKDGEIKPEYLYTFFSSDLWQKIIDRWVTGWTGQLTLPTGYLKKIKIPLLPESFQLSIEEIVKSAHQKQSDSKSLYSEAEKLLLGELGLLNYQVRNTLTFSTTRSAIRDAGRYDSEYFQPKYDEIIKRIEGYDGGCDTIGNIVKWKKGYEVGAEAYWDEGKDFIRVSDFTTHSISDDCKKIPESLFDELKKSYQLKKWEILFTKDGSIGITHVLKEEREWIVSWAFLRLTLKEEYMDFESECLALILNSMLCRMQVEKLSGGALIAHLKPSDFETFKIPLIKPSVQSQIAEKIEESHRLRKESRELLERAKKMVEEEIEQGIKI